MSEQVSFVVEHYDNDTLAEANEQLALIVARLQVENAKLRELCHDLRKEYAYLRARPRRFYVQHEARMAAIDARIRELGIEVGE